MTIDSLDAVFITAIFILPGFLISSIIDAITPPKKEPEGVYFVRCLVYSIINCAVWSWLYSIILCAKYGNAFWQWILLVIVTVLGASFLALFLATLKQKAAMQKVIEKIGINTIHSTPNAWDYYFSQQEPSFIIVTLVDGTVLYGWYAYNSFSSSDQEERDLYVEKSYSVNEKNEWTMDMESNGFYVPKDQIKYIEFMKGAENTYERSEED